LKSSKIDITTRIQKLHELKFGKVLFYWRFLANRFYLFVLLSSLSRKRKMPIPWSNLAVGPSILSVSTNWSLTRRRGRRCVGCRMNIGVWLRGWIRKNSRNIQRNIKWLWSTLPICQSVDTVVVFRGRIVPNTTTLTLTTPLIFSIWTTFTDHRVRFWRSVICDRSILEALQFLGFTSAWCFRLSAGMWRTAIYIRSITTTRVRPRFGILFRKRTRINSIGLSRKNIRGGACWGR
jgi:hypothetical protein